LQLERYNLPRPEAVFEISYFRNNPRPFHLLAKELFPGHYCPTPTHVFMRLLYDKGLLLRVYTQNIDSLEHLAGLPKDKIVPAHGNFDSESGLGAGNANGKMGGSLDVKREIAGEPCTAIVRG
jgi:NAD-dependent deacetylase sirtuin 2